MNTRLYVVDPRISDVNRVGVIMRPTSAMEFARGPADGFSIGQPPAVTHRPTLGQSLRTVVGVANFVACSVCEMTDASTQSRLLRRTGA